MAKFQVNTTFFLKPKGYFVIVGEIVEGIINKGMFLWYKESEEQQAIKLLIKDVNFIDKRVNGEVKGEIALCIEASISPIADFYNTLNLKGRTFSIKNPQRVATSIGNCQMRVTS